MRKLRWVLIPAALVLLTGYEAQSLSDCLAETTVDCALEQAVVAATQIGKDGQRAVAYGYIARVAADAGRYADARKYLGQAGSIKRTLIELTYHDSISRSQARVHAMMGEFAEAIALAEGIGNSASASMAWSWIAESQAKAGDIAGADRSLALALEAATELPPEQLSFSLALMAVVKAHGGAHEEAMGAADVALELSRRYDDDMVQARVASLVAVAQSAIGERGRARESLAVAGAGLARMAEDGAPSQQRGSALSYIVWAQALSGDGDGARARLGEVKALVPEIVDHYHRSTYLAAIALVLAKAE